MTKSVTVELPQQLAQQLEALVRSGWFTSEEEGLRVALMDFLRHQRADLVEEFQREDIAWALRQKGTPG
jgi:Arc/MetJ-type ribon-helix-helix transcriptional regulator